MIRGAFLQAATAWMDIGKIILKMIDSGVQQGCCGSKWNLEWLVGTLCQNLTKTKP